MGPRNGVVGDQSFGTDIPQTVPQDDLLAELKKKAKFSKTAEWKWQKSYLEQKIATLQHHLPGGQDISQVDPKVVGPMWIANSLIIREFENLISLYENAAEQIKQADAAARR